VRPGLRAASEQTVMRRNHLVRYALVVLLLAEGAQLAAADAPVVHLEDLVRSALEHHEKIRQADSDIRRARARVRLAGSVLLPTLDLNGKSTWYEEEVGFPISEHETLIIQPSNDWSWSADLRQTLFSGLRDWKARDVARLDLDRARIEKQAALNDVILEVSAAYLKALVSEKRVDVAQANLKQVSSQRKLTGRLVEVGENTGADLSRWEAEEASAKQELIVARGLARYDRNHLARLCGVDEIGPLSDPAALPVPEGDEEDLRKKALETRPEMGVFARQLEAANLMIGIEKGNWLPSLDLHAQYFQQKAEFPSSDWMSFSLNLSVPIYDGGRTSARVAEAREDLDRIENLLSATRRAIIDATDAALIAYRSAVAAEKASRQRLVAAEAAQKQTERAYRAGEASATDLMQTTAALTDARMSAVITRAQLRYQVIALRHAIGLEIIPGVYPAMEN